jgi:hypothetical protein
MKQHLLKAKNAATALAQDGWMQNSEYIHFPKFNYYYRDTVVSLFTLQQNFRCCKPTHRDQRPCGDIGFGNGRGVQTTLTRLSETKFINFANA